MALLAGRIGLALGSGAARGWAHVGVIRALEEAGLAPEVVCGSSSGALVGGLYAAGRLDALEAFGRRLDWRGVMGYFDLSLRGGLIKARKLVDVLTAEIPDCTLEALDRRFAAVATDLLTGHEVWLREGSLFDALRASIALPGLVTPVWIQGRWLVDGGLVNPVPVSVCRALGADSVIAVDLNTTLLGRHLDPGKPSSAEAPPSLYDVIANSISIMQVRITRSRMAGDPAELLVTPRLGNFALLDFARAAEAIEEGRRAVAVALAGAAPPSGPPP
jgi:NTE family protein